MYFFILGVRSKSVTLRAILHYIQGVFCIWTTCITHTVLGCPNPGVKNGNEAIMKNSDKPFFKFG